VCHEGCFCGFKKAGHDCASVRREEGKAMSPKRLPKSVLRVALRVALSSGLLVGALAIGQSSSTTTPAPAAASPAELVGCWLLSSNADNAVSAQCNGDLVGNGGFQDNALVLDGGYVTFGTDPALNLSGSLSFSLWLNPIKQDGVMRLLGKFQVEGNNREYCVFLGADNRLWVFLSDNGTADAGHTVLRATETAAVVNGQWQHLAVTWDATAGSEGLCVYLDGVLQPTVSAADAQINQIHAGDSHLVLGSYDVASGATNSFHGALARFLLFRGVLSSSEVSGIYGMGRDLTGGKNVSPKNVSPATTVLARKSGKTLVGSGDVTPVMGMRTMSMGSLFASWG